MTPDNRSEIIVPSARSTLGLTLWEQTRSCHVLGVPLTVTLRVVGRGDALALDVTAVAMGASWSGSFLLRGDDSFEMAILIGALVIDVGNWSTPGHLVAFDLAVRAVPPQGVPTSVVGERVVVVPVRNLSAFSAADLAAHAALLRPSAGRSSQSAALPAPPIVGLETVARDYRLVHRDSRDPARIDRIAEQLVAPAASYAANTNIWSAIFYMHLTVSAEFGTFNGDAGGLTSPFAAVSAGTIYTDDLERFINQSWRFEFQAVTAYFSVLWFADGGDFLGHFQGAAVGVVQGVGAGTGKWSR